MAEAKDGALWKMGRLLGKELVIAFVRNLILEYKSNYVFILSFFNL